MINQDQSINFHSQKIQKLQYSTTGCCYLLQNNTKLYK